MTADDEDLESDEPRWWDRPEYREARQRLLDLLELVPRPTTDPNEDTRGFLWWPRIVALADPLNRVAELSDQQLEVLLGDPPETAVRAVEELAELLRRMGVERPPARAWDNLVPTLAGMLLHIFGSEPTPELLIELGNVGVLPTWTPRSLVFGRLWHADVVDAAWTVFRSSNAATLRG